MVHLLDEFAFESFLGRHICFVTNVLCYNVPGLQGEMDDLLFPLRFILHLTKQILKGLEYLHDECDVVHSGMPLTVFIGRSDHRVDLKPANIDEVVRRELSEQPGTLYGYPKAKKVPAPPTMSAPLFHAAGGDVSPLFHWVIADFGHGTSARCWPRVSH